MRRVFVLGATLVAASALSACATSKAAPSPEQRAACEAMLAKMGSGATHDHAAEKTGGVGAMAMTHAQCRQMLGK